MKENSVLDEKIRQFTYSPQEILLYLPRLLLSSSQVASPRQTLDVVIPCYNNADTVEQAIISVLNQTHPVTRVIVIDDSSSDLSSSIVSRLSKLDSRIKLFVLRENRGAAYARNVGLQYADSDFVAFQDADDVSHPNRFETQIRFLCRHKAIAVTCDGCRMVAGKAIELDGHYYHELSISVLFRRKEVLSAIGFMRSMTIGEDVDYLYRMRAKLGKARVRHLPHCLYFASLKPGSAIYAHGEICEITNGKYRYIPSAEAQAILDKIDLRSEDPSNTFFPFEASHVRFQSRGDTA